MNIQDFIKKLEVEFDELEAGTLQADTNFRKIEDWSSMHALILIALVDVEYDVQISGEQLLQCQTLQDVFDIVVATP